MQIIQHMQHSAEISIHILNNESNGFIIVYQIFQLVHFYASNTNIGQLYGQLRGSFGAPGPLWGPLRG